MESVLLAGGLFLAFVNGANDNLKGVATLYGAGRVPYRTAVALATVSTTVGAVASVVLAHGLVEAFSGAGLVPSALLDARFLAPVALAAASTVLLATWIGMPISTTHAILGALIGAGAVLAGSELDLRALGGAFLLPLAVGPLLAVALAWAIARGGSTLGRSLGLRASSCACLAYEVTPGGGPEAVATPALRITIGHREECVAANAGAALEVVTAVDIGHWLSASAVGFARGLNDTPKILGLVVGGAAIAPTTGAVAIALVMALGGLVAARRVTETLAHRITPMTSAQGFAGNLSTSLLVIGASRMGLPMSTTHVAAGGIFGIGASGGSLSRDTARRVASAWLATLPIAAVLAALLAWGTA